MRTPSAARGEAVRERLRSAAVALIAERGWAAVSTRILADRAGVTSSVVHYHYASVQALLVEAVVDVIRGPLAEMESILETARTPAEAVDAIFGSAEDYSGEDPLSIAAIEATLAASRDPALHDQLRDAVDQFRRRFARWLAEHDVPDPEATAGVLIATIDGLLLQRGLGIAAPTTATVAILRRLVSTGQEQR